MSNVHYPIMERISKSAMVIDSEQKQNLQLELKYVLVATPHAPGYRLYQDADDNWYRLNTTHNN